MQSSTLCVLCFRRPDDAERRDGIPTGDRGNEGESELCIGSLIFFEVSLSIVVDRLEVNQ